MSAVAALAGHCVWQTTSDGSGVLRSERPDWVARLAPGHMPEALPALLGSLFSLCGHAHTLTAERAVAAARGEVGPLPIARRRALQIDTLREHLRRLWLDLPRVVWGGEGARAHGLLELAHCPLWRSDAPGPSSAGVLGLLEDTRHWLQRHVLGRAPADWWADWIQQPQACLTDWVTQHQGLPARLLAATRPWTAPVPVVLAPWWPDDDEAMRVLAAHLETCGDTVHTLPWRGQPAETGPWCRLADRPRLAARHGQACTLWWRMGARLADLAALSLPDDDTASLGLHRLAVGALDLGNRRGLAWTEMARGVLLHWVQLEDSATDPRVRACRVVSPTDWNFQPLGGAAQSLGFGLDPCQDQLRRRALATACAYDPCVPLVVRGTDGREVLRCPPETAPISVDAEEDPCTN